MEITFPDKSDNDLAVEALFGAAHGTNPEMWKAAMGGRYEGVKEEIDRLLRNNSNLLVAIQQYLKHHGHDRLI